MLSVLSGVVKPGHNCFYSLLLDITVNSLQAPGKQTKGVWGLTKDCGRMAPSHSADVLLLGEIHLFAPLTALKKQTFGGS